MTVSELANHLHEVIDAAGKGETATTVLNLITDWREMRQALLRSGCSCRGNELGMPCLPYCTAEIAKKTLTDLRLEP